MRILAISGSLREGSHNAGLLQAAAAVAPDGVDVLLYDGLKDIPPYDADDDVPGDQPLAVQRFKNALAAADVLIATPEYNSSIPGVLKNALDWASRPLVTRPSATSPWPCSRRAPGRSVACGPRPRQARCSARWAREHWRTRSRSRRLTNGSSTASTRRFSPSCGTSSRRSQRPSSRGLSGPLSPASLQGAP